MELGRISEIDHAQTNHVSKIEKVKETDEKSKIVPDEQYKNVSANSEVAEVNEVVLDNVRFGYNKQSKDFFVKVTRGEAEYKYPTEDMMRVKAYLLEAMESEIKK